MRLQARWVETAAAAEDGHDFARRLEDAGVFVRIDPSAEPLAFRGATVSRREIDAAPHDRARRAGEPGAEHRPNDGHDRRRRRPRRPARGLRRLHGRGRSGPRFRERCSSRAASRSSTWPSGFLPWCAATIGFVESTGLHDEEKNRLCPPVVFSGDAADLARFAYSAMQGQVARARDEAVGPWSAASRLNPARAALDHIDDADVAESLAFMIEHTRSALKNLERVTAGGAGAR